MSKADLLATSATVNNRPVELATVLNIMCNFHDAFIGMECSIYILVISFAMSPICPRADPACLQEMAAMHVDTQAGCYQPQMGFVRRTLEPRATMSRVFILLKLPTNLLPSRLPKPLPAGDQTWLGTPPGGCWSPKTTVANRRFPDQCTVVIDA